MDERRFRYEGARSWLRGNTHVHTTRSDGGKPPEEAFSLYAGAGYDFICLTDHWVASHEQEAAARPAVGTPPPARPLLVIDGIELDGCDAYGSFYHVVCLGSFEGLSRDSGFSAGLESARAQGGYLVLAHPAWTGNSVEEALRHPFHAVEVYNHVCNWLNGKGFGLFHWDAMLEQRPDVHGLAVDDAHISTDHPGWNGSWVMVAADDRTPAAIMQALRAGRYYSSCGPEILSIECTGAVVRCRTTQVCFARLVGPRYRGSRRGSFDGTTMTDFELPIPEDCSYLRLEIEDGRGRRAWTNTLFISAER